MSDIDELFKGACDMHLHNTPFMMPCIDALEAAKQAAEKPVTEFTEESADHHVHFLSDGPFLAVVEDTFDDDNHEEHFQGQEAKIANHVDKDVVNVLKDKVMDEVNECGD